MGVAWHETPVGRDSVEHNFERSEASGASISPAARGRGDARCARTACGGSIGSTESRPTLGLAALCFWLALAFLAVTSSHASDWPQFRGPNGLPVEGRGRLTRLAIFTLSFLLAAVLPAAEWVNISDLVTTQLKPGYGGPTAGVTVNPANGDVFMVVSDQGLWRSSDHGATFARCDDKNIGGRCETGWALNFDPAGQRLFCFMIYGSSAMTTDGGKTWAKSKVSHLDYGSVDWGDTGKRLLAIRHESGGMLTTSDDGGATWKDLEKGFNNCGVFERNTFVATKAKEKGIFRSTDAGATWMQVSSHTPTAAVPTVFKGNGYWATGKGVSVSKDKGASWSELGPPVDSSFGPLFGKDETHFVVVGQSGFSETKDGGKTWQLVAPLPAGFGVGRVGPNYAWDSKADIFYASTMTKPTFKFQR